MSSFERKTNQYLACARQLLQQSRGGVADAALVGASLAFERSVVFYLLERIAPEAGRGFDPLKFSALPDLLRYCQQHREHITCAELAALYAQPNNWLAGLAAHHARTFAGRTSELNEAFFASDKHTNEDDSEPEMDALIVSATSADNRFDARELETWLEEFISLVQRQRLESYEY